MIKIDNDKVLLLHKLLIEETGGEPNLRDIYLLDSSIKSVYQTFDGGEVYKTEEKAARFGYTLVLHHAFVDSNNRIGMYVMLTFVEANGINVSFTNQEIIDIGFKISMAEMTYEELLDEINKHKVKLANIKEL